MAVSLPADDGTFPPAAPRRRLTTYRLGKLLAPYLYLSPALILICFLMLIPMLTVIGYSLQKSVILRPDPSFAGIEHYRTIFSDPVFWAALRHTIYFTVMSVVFHMVIGLAFALMLNSNRINPLVRSILRVLYILPWLFTAVIIAVIWRLLLEPNGIVNTILLYSNVIGEKVEWFSDPDTAIHAVTFANIWAGYPLFMVSLLAGLQGIPKELYEAADVDGATRLQKLFFVTIPQLMPIIISISLLDFIWTMQVFPLVWLTTGGGPIHSTEMLGTYTYKLAFARYELSLAAASAVVILAISIAMTMLYVRHQKAR